MSTILNDFKSAFRYGNVLNQLIIVNVVLWLAFSTVFIIAKASSAPWLFEAVYDAVAFPSNPLTFLYRPWTILTYGFFHSAIDLFHILFNMMFLYMFGRIIQDLLGNEKIISIFIWGVLVGAGLMMITYNTVPYFITQGAGQMVGASAGVTAIVVAAATLTPDYRFNLIFLGPVKIVYIAAFVVLMSYIQSIGHNAGGNIAHLGGAFAGYLFIKQIQKGTDLGKPVIWVFNWGKNIFKPRPSVRVTHRASGQKKTTNTSANSKTAVNQKEIDTILDKISQSGYESLTKDEKEKLFSASQKK